MNSALSTKFIAPCVFNIASTSDLTILNFNVLDAMQFFGRETYTKDGDLILDYVSVSSGTADKTYREKLCQFKSTAYSVGITYIQSSIAGQSMEPIYLRKGGISELLVPTIDPYQENPEIVAIKRPFCIDGTTKIVLSKLYPHSTIKLYFYPEESMNLARGLCGRLSHKRFNSSIFLTGK